MSDNNARTAHPRIRLPCPRFTLSVFLIIYREIIFVFLDGSGGNGCS
ncbi:hypothetical protein [Bacteroides heparinolyticus]